MEQDIVNRKSALKIAYISLGDSVILFTLTREKLLAVVLTRPI